MATDNYFEKLKKDAMAKGIDPGKLSPVELQAALNAKIDLDKQTDVKPNTSIQPLPNVGNKTPVKTPAKPVSKTVTPRTPSTAPKPKGAITAQGTVGTASKEADKNKVNETVLEEGMLDWIIRKFKKSKPFKNFQEKRLFTKMQSEFHRQWVMHCKRQDFAKKNESAPNLKDGKPTIKDFMVFVGHVFGNKMMMEVSKSLPVIRNRLRGVAPPSDEPPVDPYETPWTSTHADIFAKQTALWNDILTALKAPVNSNTMTPDELETHHRNGIKKVEELISLSNSVQAKYKEALARHPTDPQNQPYGKQSPEFAETSRMLADIKRNETDVSGVPTSLDLEDAVLQWPQIANFERLLHEARLLAFKDYLIENNVFSLRGLVKAQKEFFCEASSTDDGSANLYSLVASDAFVNEIILEIVGLMLLDPAYAIAARHFGFDTPEYHNYMNAVRYEMNNQSGGIPYSERLKTALGRIQGINQTTVDKIMQLLKDNDNDFEKVIQKPEFTTLLPDMKNKIIGAVHKAGNMASGH